MEILYRDFISNQAEARASIETYLNDRLPSFKKYFSIQQFYFYKSLKLIADKTDTPDYVRAISQCIIKSSHLNFTINELILNGNHGAAKVLLRQNLEYLFIGKYLLDRHEFAEKWLKSEEFKTNNYLFNRLKNPIAKNLQELWNMLCNQVHAKTKSLQIDILNSTIYDIESSFVMNCLLLLCKERLVGHFIKEVGVFFPEISDSIASMESESKKCKLKLNEAIGDPGLDFVNDYISDWELKTEKSNNMLNLGNLILPTSLDYDSSDQSIHFEIPDIETYDYIENSECSLQITFQGSIVFIDYYCEDDFLLSEVYGLDHFASGNLEEESFITIQKRALEKINEIAQ